VTDDRLPPPDGRSYGQSIFDVSGLTAAELFAPEHRRNPHPLYHRVRSSSPLLYAADGDETILTRWADCEAVLRDSRWSGSPDHRRDAGYEVPRNALKVHIGEIADDYSPGWSRVNRST
jgi:hypothetical protein